MVRTAARHTVFLAAATLAMGALAVNCSRHKGPAHNSELGSVGLAITLPSGPTISSVHVVIRNSAMVQVAAGNIAVTGAAHTVSVVVGGIAAGTGYTVALDATASDGSNCLGASIPFAVIANMTTSVNVLLLCRSAGGAGTIVINRTIDNCPVVNSYTAAPLAVAVGGTVSVGAVGFDSDATDTVSYLWTAAGGSFAAPTSASTTYTCPATGSSQQTLTITVSDSKCTTPATIVVSCGSCGNGVLQAGEQCDPPVTGFCSPTCQNLDGEECGDGLIQVPGEQCDPPGPIAGSAYTCSPSCKIVMPAGSGGAGVGGSAGGSTVTGSGGSTGSGGAGVGGSVGGSTG